MTADAKPPKTSFAADESFIPMLFARGSGTNPEPARIVVTFSIAWKTESRRRDQPAASPTAKNVCVLARSI
jgi:hypothetical protein